MLEEYRLVQEMLESLQSGAPGNPGEVQRNRRKALLKERDRGHCRTDREMLHHGETGLTALAFFIGSRMTCPRTSASTG